MNKKILDSLYSSIQDRAIWLRDNHNTLAQAEIAVKQLEIANLETTFLDKQNTLNSEYDSLRSKAIEPIYDEVNKFIEDYAKQHGYNFVFGNLGNGNIMYGYGSYDITLEVIDGLNVKYSKQTIQ